MILNTGELRPWTLIRNAVRTNHILRQSVSQTGTSHQGQGGGGEDEEEEEDKAG
jgi:hypothetical protein